MNEQVLGGEEMDSEKGSQNRQNIYSSGVDIIVEKNRQ